MEEGNAKRRRGLGLVTPNACTECRKKRTKCDGQTPCGRCASLKGIQCVYEIPVRQSKEEMRTEIDRLKALQSLNERVFTALVSDESEQVLEQLRRGETIESITGRLNTGKSSPSTEAAPSRGSVASSSYSTAPFSETSQSNLRASSWPEWTGESSTAQSVAEASQPETMAWSPSLDNTWNQQSNIPFHRDVTADIMSDGGRAIFLGSGSYGNLEPPNYPTPWTSVTSEADLIQHLVALYFCWEYPTFATLDQRMFLRDFRDGIPRYCSSMLVNALLAVGSRCSTHYATRADPNDSSTAGDHFFAESVRLFEQEKDHHHLTTIQALGLMSIREASRGHTSSSIFYSSQSISLAVEMGLHLDMSRDKGSEMNDERTVRCATFWGAFSLDQCWSLSVGKLPHTSVTISLPPKPDILEDIEASPWVPYSGEDAPHDRSPLAPSYTQPSNVQSVYKTFCELSEIVHQSLYVLYSPGEPITSKSLLRVYTKYLRWYDSIPAVLKLGHNFTPAVLFSHMYYHYAILLLFRPFIKLDIASSGVSPRDVCHQAAHAISTLLTSYNQLYTLRRTPSFVPFFILSSTITHLVAFGNHHAGAERLNQGMSDLRIMTECHGFARRARQIIFLLRTIWNIGIDLERLPDDDGDDEGDIYLACRPKTKSTNLWSLNVRPEDIIPNITPVKNISENPLFWLFPFQGRPLLEDGGILEKSGFKLPVR